MEKIGNTLKQLRENAGISVKSVSEYLVNRGFKANASTIYSWENDNSQPTPGALLAMCEFYKVPDVLSAFGYEYEDEDDKNIHFDQNEKKLIEKYRALDSYGKEAVDRIIDIEYRRCEEKIQITEEELRKLPLEERLVLERFLDDDGELVARHKNNKK